MPDIRKPTGDILRRNPEHECGQPIGQISVKVHGMANFQTISFYCNKKRLHTDQCAFEGNQVIVTAARLSFTPTGLDNLLRP